MELTNEERYKILCEVEKATTDREEKEAFAKCPCKLCKGLRKLLEIGD